MDTGISTINAGHPDPTMSYDPALEALTRAMLNQQRERQEQEQQRRLGESGVVGGGEQADVGGDQSMTDARSNMHVTGMDSTLAEHMATMDPSLLAGSLQAYKSSSNRASVCTEHHPNANDNGTVIARSSSPPLHPRTTAVDSATTSFVPYPNAEASSSTSILAPPSDALRSTVADSTSTSPADVSGKRGRGRPKGSKNKPKDRNAPDYKPTKGELRERAKYDENGERIWKKRGRPPKIRTNNETTDVESRKKKRKKEPPAGGVPAKKGRPRKNPDILVRDIRPRPRRKSELLRKAGGQAALAAAAAAAAAETEVNAETTTAAALAAANVATGAGGGGGIAREYVGKTSRVSKVRGNKRKGRVERAAEEFVIGDDDEDDGVGDGGDEEREGLGTGAGKRPMMDDGAALDAGTTIATSQFLRPANHDEDDDGETIRRDRMETLPPQETMMSVVTSLQDAAAATKATSAADAGGVDLSRRRTDDVTLGRTGGDDGGNIAGQRIGHTDGTVPLQELGGDNMDDKDLHADADADDGGLGALARNFETEGAAVAAAAAAYAGLQMDEQEWEALLMGADGVASGTGT